MANLKKRVLENVEGEFFVDSTCIDCDTCRQLAPEIFEDSGNNSFVKNQPEGPAQTRAAMQALLACPTGSIGTLHPHPIQEVMKDFPVLIEEDVYYCGFNSPQSFGGNSYFIKHAQGNWLIDSPKFLPHLVRQFEERGGVRYIFLTHQDDVADAAKYAEKFGSQRIIHEEDRRAQPDAEILLQGTTPTERQPGFKIIPTPGHTKGHCVLLYKNKFLFTGDHLWWRRKRQQLGASESVAWYSWAQQTESMEKLLRFDFEWILPGHGERVKRSASQMKTQLERLIIEMKGRP
jgi:glyoxylase-like metal-dependent hydrolase (beta-lactamase superfamily II)/ferredoxin